MNRKLLVLISVASVVGAAVGAWGWNWYDDRKSNDAAAMQTSGAADERKVLYWHDPMVPGPKFEKPGKSPFMDMQLVPVYAEDAQAADDGAVKVSPQVVQKLGVRTAPVTRNSEPRQLTAWGYVFRDSGGTSVLVDIFERDTAWVKRGLSARVRTPGGGDRTWHGVVNDVSSDLDIGARSFKARVRLRDAKALRVNQQAQVTILGPRPARGALVIPREALIRTGSRTAVVLALGEGRFKPVPVVAGPESGDWIEIQDGVHEGDEVVVSGQFLIDSEASLRASFDRLQPPNQTAPEPTP